mmetsp:Transcript_9891/g.7440  ORF Transcript_9891/g.7440 Transcript_9891/m.7440 type:complete len:87 (-) Transcript_9891:349-609(-)
MEPKSEKERNIIKNEIGLMIKCAKETDSILQCYEVFDYKERLWLFLEYMDCGCLTDLAEESKGQIPENICAYILYQTLRGLDFLHS